METNTDIFDYTQKLETIINRIEQTGIQKFKNKTIQIRELIKKLEVRINANELAKLLEIISKADEIILENEFKTGVDILLKHGEIKLVFDFIMYYCDRKQTIDESFVINIVNKCFDYNCEFDIAEILIKQTIEMNKNQSNGFWEMVMNGYLKISPGGLFLYYLSIYPTSNLFNEKMFRSIIIYHMKANLISHFFNELNKKFIGEKNDTSIKTAYFFESLFDIFLDELANY
jgi:hypothetical protein